MSDPTNAVLGVSGGGIKGYMELLLLAYIEAKTGIPICKLCPTIAGTSVGALIAVLLSIPKEPGSKEPRFSAQEALELFERSAADIFPQHWYHQGKIGQMFSHKHSQKPLKKLLKEHLKDIRFDDLLADVYITVFQLNSDNPTVLFNRSDYPDLDLIEGICAAVAAPSYYKGAKIAGKDGKIEYYIDGGIADNRPGASFLRHVKNGLNREQQGKVLDDMMLVTLNFQSPDEKQEMLPPHLDGLIPHLANGLVNNMMKAAQSAATQEVERDLPGKGQFFNLLLPVPKGSTKLDDSSPGNMAKLKKAAEQYLKDNEALIEEVCKSLVRAFEARDEAAKLQESEISVDEPIVADDHLISEAFEAKLAIELDERQVGVLKEGLMKLTPKEYAVLQVFLQGLNDTQLASLSKSLPSIADGNFKNVNIPEFSNFQNKFLKFFSSMFEHEDNIINYALSCQEYHNEVRCDGIEELVPYVDVY